MFLLDNIDERGRVSTLMIGSIAGCFLSIAYLVATAELDIDTSKSFRTK
jgi:hypothetical protein